MYIQFSHRIYFFNIILTMRQCPKVYFACCWNTLELIASNADIHVYISENSFQFPRKQQVQYYSTNLLRVFLLLSINSEQYN